MAKLSTASPLQRLMQGALIGLAAFALAASGWSLLQPLESKTWDMRASYFAKASPATDSIRLIFLDQASLDWGKNDNGLSWPWVRQAYVPIIDFCRRAGARSLCFDVLMTEPTQYEDDIAFGMASRTNGRVVQAYFPAGKSTNWPAAYPAPYAPGTPDPAHAHAAARSRSATFPIPEVATNAALLAHVGANQDPDGVLRRIAPFTLIDGRFIPGLGLASVMLDTPRPTPAIDPHHLRLGAATIPLDSKGYAILRFRGPSQTNQTVNAKAVIQSELNIEAGQKPLIDPAFFKDKYVFFGFTAHGLYDLRTTPMGKNYPGVEVHATALDNLLTGEFMTEFPKPAALAITFLLCLLAGISIRFCRSAIASAFLLAGFILIPVALAWGLYPLGYWMPFVAPETGVSLALVAALVTNYAAEGRQKRFIKGAFSQYLSPVVIEQLVRNPEKLTLGGEKKPLTILFSDIKGFTSISETLDAQALTSLLNEYLTAVTAIIYEEGGTIDKYEGDAVIAFWNAPLDMPDHALRGVRACIRYQDKLMEIRPILHEKYGHDLFVRIGLHTGPVVIGNMGSLQRFNYTFLGDAGNLASRLEGINKQFGTPILVSQVTRDQAGEAYAFRKIARVGVVGRKEPVCVYEPMTHEAWQAGQAVFAPFAAALDLFEKGDFNGMLGVVTALAATDPVSDSYRRKCEELLRHPPARWDGVWVMTEK